MSLTRRSFFQASAAIVGGAGLVTLGAKEASAEKVAQNVVAYQDTPKGDQKCSGCKWFEAPQSCKLVDGVISPNGWCTLWVKA